MQVRRSARRAADLLACLCLMGTLSHCSERVDLRVELEPEVHDWLGSVGDIAPRVLRRRHRAGCRCVKASETGSGCLGWGQQPQSLGEPSKVPRGCNLCGTALVPQLRGS